MKTTLSSIWDGWFYILYLPHAYLFRPNIFHILKHVYLLWIYILSLQIFVYKPEIVVYLINNSTHNKIFSNMKRISISVWSDLNRQEYSITCPIRVQTPKRVSCTQLLLSKISTVFPKARKLDKMWNIRDDSFFIYSHVQLNLQRFQQSRWKVCFLLVRIRKWIYVCSV